MNKTNVSWLKSTFVNKCKICTFNLEFRLSKRYSKAYMRRRKSNSSWLLGRGDIVFMAHIFLLLTYRTF